jgi:hypothetical protein
MAATTDIPLLDHELAEDELAWAAAVHADFAASRGGFASPREALKAVLGKPEHRLPTPMDLSGPGPWRGANRHGRTVAAVFLPRAELHTHPRSRTDQFAMYVRGEADNFALDAAGNPVLTPVAGGRHFHNPPGAPHAFLPKAGQPIPPDWEIGFIAITPRNLREDTYPVSPAVRAAYQAVTGVAPPAEA